MEFSLAKTLLIKMIEERNYYFYTERFDILDKNKLYTREVNDEFVLNKIKTCKRRNYHTEFSLDADDNKAHIFIKDRWYIKFCLIDGEIYIVSVHKEEKYV